MIRPRALCCGGFVEATRRPTLCLYLILFAGLRNATGFKGIVENSNDARHARSNLVSPRARGVSCL